MKIRSFDEALKIAKSPDKKKINLLIGNGFSMAWNHQIFSFPNLLKSADSHQMFADCPEVRKLFDVFETTDFEIVIKHLQSAATINTAYGIDHNSVERLNADADKLKNILASVIAKNHPEYPSDITETQSASCREFLSNFSKIFTLNYDLLLYWTVNVHETLEFRDGFHAPNEEPDAEYVCWQLGDERNSPNLIYLHGALHLFDLGHEIKKFSWIRTGIRLKEQVLNALNENKYPVFVSEGTSLQKLDRINHQSYLCRSFRSFQQTTGTLFIYGSGLKDNDLHIMQAIECGKYKRLFISVYGDLESADNKKLIANANRMKSRRNQIEADRAQKSKRRSKDPTNGNELEVYFFDAASCKIWNLYESKS